MGEPGVAFSSLEFRLLAALAPKMHQSRSEQVKLIFFFAAQMRDNSQTVQRSRVCQLRRRQIDDFRDYASHEDFCRIFHTDMSQLYLLAFLLTANHQEAEQCFVRTLEEVSQNRTVFRKSAPSLD